MDISFDLVVLQLFTGLALGAIYVLLAVGLSLIFGMLTVVNFAHGAFFMLGAYLGATLIGAGVNFWLAALGGGLLVALLGGLLERFVLRALAGHEQGSKSIRACVEACMDTGVEFLTLYAFSSENWKRPKPEIHGLMLLLEKFLNDRKREMMEENVRLLAIGRIGELPTPCQRKLQEVIDATAGNTKLTIVLALSYSGRTEIIDAVRAQLQVPQAAELAVSYSGGLFQRGDLLLTPLRVALTVAPRKYRFLGARLPPEAGAALQAAKLSGTPLTAGSIARLEADMRGNNSTARE